jgi:methyltransferase (TIGR00027 family)
MRCGIPSRTALGAALRRAAHQVLDDPRVFEDPLAVALAGAELEAELRAERSGPTAGASRYLRAFLAARGRYAEDQLAAAIGRGARQYVVLGAGLDTYAYRNPHAGLRVFEVDHPATQAWKRERLQEAGIPIPDSLAFVSVDFERQMLAGELAAAGFRLDRPAFFSWLGVVMYLNLEPAMATLRFIGGLPPASGGVFDYALEGSASGPVEAAAHSSLAARVTRAGEPFRLFFEPDRLAAMLREAGFTGLEDLGPEEINMRYFRDRADGLHLARGRARLMSAWI